MNNPQSSDELAEAKRREELEAKEEELYLGAGSGKGEKGNYSGME